MFAPPAPPDSPPLSHDDEGLLFLVSYLTVLIFRGTEGHGGLRTCIYAGGDRRIRTERKQRSRIAYLHCWNISISTRTLLGNTREIEKNPKIRLKRTMGVIQDTSWLQFRRDRRERELGVFLFQQNGKITSSGFSKCQCNCIFKPSESLTHSG